MSEIVERILELLKRDGMSAKELMVLLGVNRSTISEWKKGKIKPSVEHIIKIAEIFHVSTDYILIGYEKELTKDVQLKEGYDFEGHKVTITDEQAALVREIINKELNERVEEAVRKVIQKEESEATTERDEGNNKG